MLSINRFGDSLGDGVLRRADRLEIKVWKVHGMTEISFDVGGSIVSCDEESCVQADLADRTNFVQSLLDHFTQDGGAA